MALCGLCHLMPHLWWFVSRGDSSLLFPPSQSARYDNSHLWSVIRMSFPFRLYAAVSWSIHSDSKWSYCARPFLLGGDSCNILLVIWLRIHQWCPYASPTFNNKGYVAKPLCPSSLLFVTISSLLTYPPVVMRLTSKSLASKVLLALMSVLAESLLTLMGSHLVALLLLTVWHNTFLFKG